MSTARADTMNLATEDIQFIKEHLGEWLAEQSLGKPAAVYGIELRERMIRVERRAQTPARADQDHPGADG